MKQNTTTSVRAVIIKNGEVLTLRREFDDGDIIWTFPGGHIEESDKNEKESLKRECKEEVNLEVMVGRKIFEQNFKGKINDFYLCTIIAGVAGHGNGPEYTEPEIYRGTHEPEWLSIIDLNKYDLRPNELKNQIIKDYKSNNL